MERNRQAASSAGSTAASSSQCASWCAPRALDAAGFADSAGKDRGLAHAAADHKSNFFAESMPDGAPIDYRAAVTGALHLAPSGGARKALVEDYQDMVEDALPSHPRARADDRL